MHEVVLEWTAADRGAVYQGQCSRLVLTNASQLASHSGLPQLPNPVDAELKYACCFHRLQVQFSGSYRSRRPTKHIRFIDPAVVGTNELMGHHRKGRVLFFHVSGDKTPSLLLHFLVEAGYKAGVSKDQSCTFSHALPNDTLTDESETWGAWRTLFDEMYSYRGFANPGMAALEGRPVLSRSLPGMITRCDAKGTLHDSDLMPHEQIWRTWDWRFRAGLLREPLAAGQDPSEGQLVPSESNMLVPSESNMHWHRHCQQTLSTTSTALKQLPANSVRQFIGAEPLKSELDGFCTSFEIFPRHQGSILNMSSTEHA